MDALIYVIKNLPGAGKRLGNGLGLRITRADCFNVLAASRVAQPPGEQEMDILLKAVIEIWNPSHVWRGKVMVSRRVFNGRDIEDHIWRLYWSTQSLDLVHENVTQEEFPF